MLACGDQRAAVDSPPVPQPLLDRLERALELAYQANDTIELAVATWRWQSLASGLTPDEQTLFSRAGRYLNEAVAHRSDPATRVRVAIAIALKDGEVDVAVELLEVGTRAGVLPTGPGPGMTSKTSGTLEAQ